MEAGLGVEGGSEEVCLLVSKPFDQTSLHTINPITSPASIPLPNYSPYGTVIGFSISHTSHSCTAGKRRASWSCPAAPCAP